jgi:hypothetical protein
MTSTIPSFSRSGILYLVRQAFSFIRGERGSKPHGSDDFRNDDRCVLCGMAPVSISIELDPNCRRAEHLGRAVQIGADSAWLIQQMPDRGASPLPAKDGPLEVHGSYESAIRISMNSLPIRRQFTHLEVIDRPARNNDDLEGSGFLGKQFAEPTHPAVIALHQLVVQNDYCSQISARDSRYSVDNCSRVPTEIKEGDRTAPAATTPSVPSCAVS